MTDGYTLGMLHRVISGGQTGVDQAALRAASACGIPTGGWMPKGWRTNAGPRPGFKAMYGMRQSGSVDYQNRTVTNVTDAHATLRLASDWSSPGERCTLRAIQATGRPYMDVTIVPGSEVPGMAVSGVLMWLRSMGGPICLNVAGNSERTSPGIGDAAEVFLRRVFVELIEHEPALARTGLLERLPVQGDA